MAKTVRELIQLLEQKDPNLEVVIPGFMGRVISIKGIRDTKAVIQDNVITYEDWNFVGDRNKIRLKDVISIEGVLYPEIQK